MIFCVMGDRPFVEAIHLVIGYIVPDRHVDTHNGRMLGAIDKAGPNGVEPTFVTIRDTSFGWITMKKIHVSNNKSNVATFYGTAQNRGKFFTLPSEENNTATEHIPTMPLVPAEIGRQIVRRHTIPWELQAILETFREGKSEQVQQLLEPT